MPQPQVPLPVSVYIVGDTATVRFTCSLPDTPAQGQPVGTLPTYVDPGGITVGVQPPTVANYYLLTYGIDPQIAKLGVGIYEVSIPVTEARRWRIRWHSTANGQNQGDGVREWIFEGKLSQMAILN